MVLGFETLRLNICELTLAELTVQPCSFLLVACSVAKGLDWNDNKHRLPDAMRAHSVYLDGHLTNLTSSQSLVWKLLASE